MSCLEAQICEVCTQQQWQTSMVLLKMPLSKLSLMLEDKHQILEMS